MIVNSKTDKGHTALHYAAYKGNINAWFNVIFNKFVHKLFLS